MLRHAKSCYTEQRIIKNKVKFQKLYCIFKSKFNEKNLFFETK